MEYFAGRGGRIMASRKSMVTQETVIQKILAHLNGEVSQMELVH